jgi:siroheme synthase (precorrin-2 oxidase/ferrochelatase)
MRRAWVVSWAALALAVGVRRAEVVVTGGGQVALHRVHSARLP